jgi:hypothetical protein
MHFDPSLILQYPFPQFKTKPKKKKSSGSIPSSQNFELFSTKFHTLLVLLQKSNLFLLLNSLGFAGEGNEGCSRGW